MVGIFIVLVISLAVDVCMHSKTIPKTPILSKSLESFKSSFFSFSFFPFNLNYPFTVCGKIPK